MTPNNVLLIGSKYGKWTVISYEGRDKKSNQLYECQCECGLKKIHRKSTLKSGNSVQCKQCYTNDIRKFSDIVGQRFGGCIVLSRIENNRDHESCYLVKCDCGRERKALGYKLKAGHSTKCPHCRVKTHGMSYTDTFRIWTGILRRCNNSNFKAYRYYGGRGITICDRWLKFENFLADMGERPDNLSIDRINNDGNYEPGNCRWVTTKVNNANRNIIKKLKE